MPRFIYWTLISLKKDKLELLMQNLRFTDIINWPGGPSDGALPLSLNANLGLSPTLGTTIDVLQQLQQVETSGSWIVSGASPDGYVSCLASIHMTGSIPRATMVASVCRAVCLY